MPNVKQHCRDCGAAVNVKTHGITFADGGTESQRERESDESEAAMKRQADRAAIADKLADALRALRHHDTQQSLYAAQRAADEALAEYDTTPEPQS